MKKDMEQCDLGFFCTSELTRRFTKNGDEHQRCLGSPECEPLYLLFLLPGMALLELNIIP